MGNTLKVDITMYGIAEVLHWCHDRNKGESLAWTRLDLKR
jgi:hypothetical protein